MTRMIVWLFVVTFAGVQTPSPVTVQKLATLASGNAQLLAQLRERFVSGPIDWTKIK